MGTLAPEAKALRAFWNQVLLRRSSFSGGYDNPQREPAMPLVQSNIATSQMDVSGTRHQVVLDIDHPAWLVKSTTPGHYHLYIEVPGGIDAMKYFRMLDAMAEAGVIERGYAAASQRRGYSAVRLPWVKKEK